MNLFEQEKVRSWFLFHSGLPALLQAHLLLPLAKWVKYLQEENLAVKFSYCWLSRHHFFYQSSKNEHGYLSA